MTYDEIIEAIKTAAEYNGLDEMLNEWKNLKPNEYGQIECPLFDYGYGVARNQAEIYWMICVLLFGTYGTSPRSGWIEDIDGFRAFLGVIADANRMKMRGDDS